MPALEGPYGTLAATDNAVISRPAEARCSPWTLRPRHPPEGPWRQVRRRQRNAGEDGEMEYEVTVCSAPPVRIEEADRCEVALGGLHAEYLTQNVGPIRELNVRQPLRA